MDYLIKTEEHRYLQLLFRVYVDKSNIDKITLLSTISVTANVCRAHSRLSKPLNYPNFSDVSQEVWIIESLLYNPNVMNSF